MVIHLTQPRFSSQLNELKEKKGIFRLYFIACEKKLREEQQKKFPIPQTYSEALLLAANQAKQIEIQTKQLEEQKPKVEFYDTVTGSKETIDMREVATTLHCGIGRNKIFEILRNNKILDGRNKPYQKYVDCGYFRTVESSYCKPDGSECINIKTVVFQKGIEFIKKMIADNRKYKTLFK